MAQTFRGSFCSQTKGNWRKNNKCTHTPVSTQAVTSLCFRPISWGRAAGCGQRFPQNNVTRRGIPVRPRKRRGWGGREGGGGGPAQTEQAGWRHLNRLWHPPGDPSLTLPPSLCLCQRGRNLMRPANCWLPNSSLTGWGRLTDAY